MSKYNEAYGEQTFAAVNLKNPIKATQEAKKCSAYLRLIDYYKSILQIHY